MTIPAFGTTSLNAVQTEFGGTNPIGISEYYNADPYKPVPSAGTIKLSNFRGTSSRTARITTAFSDDVEPRAGYSAYKGSMYYGRKWIRRVRIWLDYQNYRFDYG